MASEKAKQLAAEQKAAAKAEKLRKKNSDDPRDWGRVKQVVEAYKRTAEVDPAVTWWMLGVGLGTAAVIIVAGLLLGWPWWSYILLALMAGFLGALFVLTRRVRTATIKRYEGQPGSAEVALQLLNNKKYSYDMGINADRQMDLVHRVVGPMGIVLIGEGSPGRVRQMLASDAKKHEQVSFGTPVVTVMVGDGANQIKLGDLQKHIEKMPKALQTHQITELKQRLRALDAVRPRAPLPKGPMPTPKGLNRAMRGR
ncbi:DUF4191 domain-containing protein [Propioniciclava flava]|uniref:DUF4191 domain-containing protein n=1 Tax=Propioniciclava flava TaxID=2072026 RepID=A0A4Q2EI86_9ACTN|nr:DUF4191 domain-containing protein [Propioniciclava flava]RXW32312.1 DUF4191 domain-containing protein [Propioniciclava flava]